MKICRFDNDRLGVVLGDAVADVTAVTESLPARRWPLPDGDDFIAALPTLRNALEKAAADAPRRKLGEVTLLSPVANPRKVIAVPVNYVAHQDEANADRGITFGKATALVEKLGFFLKAPTSVVGPDAGVQIHHPDRRTDHEIELALVIGKRARNVAEKDAFDYVAGYCCGLDMTVRGEEDRSWRKSLDTFTVLGPWLVTADEFGPPDAIGLVLKVDGEIRQNANTRDLVWNIPRIIAFASTSYTLEPGDVILTGTPEGVGPVVPGNVMDVAIDRIGCMRVAVR